MLIRQKIRNFGSRPKLLMMVIGLLLVGLAAYLAISTIVSNSVDCNKVIATANNDMKAKKYKQAYALLSSHTSHCASTVKTTGKPSTTQTNAAVQSIKYGTEAANSAYLSGNKQQAEQYSTQTLKTIQSMSQTERQQVPSGLIYQSIGIQAASASSGGNQ